MNRLKETLMKYLFLLCACVCVLWVLLICLFLFAKGLPAMTEIGPLDFLFGRSWKPGQGLYGIAPMIVGSFCVTAGAMAVGVLPGIFTAVYMEKFGSARINRLLRPSVSLMAGIPSILYGFFGLVVLVPFMRTLTGGGKSILTASILLGIMILPTIISVSEAALQAVPASFYEGALALGASHERSVFFVVLPAARSGVLAAVVLGMGRAVGETMAVVMVAGNQAVFPEELTSGIRTLTANIVLEMGYAADLHRGALIATGVVLFVFILLMNLFLSLVKGRKDN